MSTKDEQARAALARTVLRMSSFLEADVIRVTKMSAKALDNLIGRSLFLPTAGSPGRGGRRMFCVEDAIVLAVVQRLGDLGVGPQRAVSIAALARSWALEDNQIAHFLEWPSMRALPAARLVISAEAEGVRIECPPRAATPSAAITLDLSGLVRDVITGLYGK